MPILMRDNAEIYYSVTPAANNSGLAILLTHGYSSSAEMWREQIQTYSQFATVITWDMRGHARTKCEEKQQYFSHESSLADMAALLDNLQIDKAIIAGQSLGGYLSLMFRNKYPERVLALILLSTGPGFRNEEGRDKWNKFALRQAEKYETRGLEALPTHALDIPADLHTSAIGLAMAARGILTQKDSEVMDSLPNIAVPCAICVGSDDKQYLSGAEYMHKKITGSEYLLIENTGHAPNLEDANSFNTLTCQFLADHGLAIL